MNNDPDSGFDQTPEGRELIALLAKHAPPQPDSRAGAQAVMARLRAAETPAPRGRLFTMRWLVPLVGAAAAVAIAFVVLSTPPNQTTPNTPPLVSDKDDPAPDTDRRAVVIRHDRAWPEIVGTVRNENAEGVTIDAGLKDGLRVGDTLDGPQNTRVRVIAVGVFESRVSVSGGTLVPGTELRARVTTDAQKRAAQFADFGGDPGAFYQFGALVSALPLSEARMLGISDGAALRVDETIPALLKDAGGAPQSTIAAQLDLRTGDVIVEVNGTNVRNENEFAKALGWSLDPRMLSIRVLRNGKQTDLTLR